jgi:hypothetical protein
VSTAHDLYKSEARTVVPGHPYLSRFLRASTAATHFLLRGEVSNWEEKTRVSLQVSIWARAQTRWFPRPVDSNERFCRSADGEKIRIVPPSRQDWIVVPPYHLPVVPWGPNIGQNTTHYH